MAGIVNGTTNYILSAMDSTGADYATALADASALGYAEADPTADVEGYDAAAKAAILASIAFHTRVTADDVYREGITKVSPPTSSRRRRWAAPSSCCPSASVSPTMKASNGFRLGSIRRWCRWSTRWPSVNGAFNAVVVEAEAAGRLMFYGQGAGGAPTASAVMGDVVMAARNRVQGGRGPRESKYAQLPIAPIGFIPTRYYVSMNVADRPGVLSSVAAEFGKREVSIAEVRQEGMVDEGGQRVRRPHRRRHPPGQRCRTVRNRRRAGRSRSRAEHQQRAASGRNHRMSTPRTAVHQPWPGLIAAYRDRLPVERRLDADHPARGRHPADPRQRLSEQTGCTVHLKVEGLNPTGSFKDRGMTMAVTEAVARGQKAVLCASTGNTSASAAAYAARAGITCAVLIPQGKIAMGKLAQAVMHGAKIIQIDGNFDDCLELARKLTADFPTISLVNSVNPVRIEGQKTAAFEIVDALGTAPDVHALPVGNAGNITAYWKGYTEYHRDGLLGPSCPACWAPRPRAQRRWCSANRSASPETIATAIRIGSPASWTSAVEAQQQSNGRFLAATDEEILAAYHLVARTEGVFVEPASAASIAGLLKSVEDGWVKKGSTVVCTVTGNGLKDPDTALKGMPTVTPLPVDPVAVVAKLGLV